MNGAEVWIDVPWMECKDHGDACRILTDIEQKNDGKVWCQDGDRVECKSGCAGWMTADYDSFWPNWDTEREVTQ